MVTDIAGSGGNRWYFRVESLQNNWIKSQSHCSGFLLFALIHNLCGFLSQPEFWYQLQRQSTLRIKTDHHHHVTCVLPINNDVLSLRWERTHCCNFDLRSLLHLICLARFWLELFSRLTYPVQIKEKLPRIFISRFIDHQRLPRLPFEQICFVIDRSTINDLNLERGREKFIWQCKKWAQFHSAKLVLNLFTRLHILWVARFYQMSIHVY